MSYRFFVCAAALAAVSTVPLAAQAPKPAAPAAKSKNWTAPRTPDGHPDLQGVWTNATITPMERPPALANKPTLTDAEAAKLEKYSADELANLDGKSEGPLLAAAGSSGTGGYNVLFIDRGS